MPRIYYFATSELFLSNFRALAIKRADTTLVVSERLYQRERAKLLIGKKLFDRLIERTQAMGYVRVLKVTQSVTDLALEQEVYRLLIEASGPPIIDKLFRGKILAGCQTIHKRILDDIYEIRGGAQSLNVSPNGLLRKLSLNHPLRSMYSSAVDIKWEDEENYEKDATIVRSIAWRAVLLKELNDGLYLGLALVTGIGGAYPIAIFVRWVAPTVPKLGDFLANYLLTFPVLGIAAILAVAGVALYAIRSRFRLFYGLVETWIGIYVTWLAIPHVDAGRALSAVGGPGLDWVKVVTGLYVIVRGLDNIGKQIKERHSAKFLGQVWGRLFGERY
ncbi:hypothetical protein AB4Y32_37650 [Paraburkholderia phymatum]|uniref:Uncharacterized protein n=1 Tax=Paraburkholderia phymatum TaxID=148447 RepID=A0ACC6UCV5_9BURK